MEIPINNKYSIRHFGGLFTIFNKYNPNLEKVSLKNQNGQWSFSEIIHNGNKVYGYNGKYNTIEDALRVLGGDMVSTFASKIKEIDRGSGYSSSMVSRPIKRNSRVRETFYRKPRGLRRFSNKKNTKKRSLKKKRARSRKKR